MQSPDVRFCLCQLCRFICDAMKLYYIIVYNMVAGQFTIGESRPGDSAIMTWLIPTGPAPYEQIK